MWLSSRLPSKTVGPAMLSVVFCMTLNNVASAVVRNWTASSGNWSNPANWAPFGTPATGDQVGIAFGDGVARTITYDDDAPAAFLTSLTIDLSGSFSRATTFNMTAGSLGSQVARIGDGGRGIFNQSGGVHTSTSSLVIGYDTLAVGSYNLTGDAYLDARNVHVGNLGTGTVTIQDDAILRAWNFLAINNQSSVTLNGGTLKFNVADAPQRINYLSGTIHLENDHTVGGDAAVAALFGSPPTVPVGKRLIIDYATVDSQNFTIDGGRFETYQLDVKNYAVVDMLVVNGGTVTSTYGYIGYEPVGAPVQSSVIVRGPGSSWTTETLVMGKSVQIGSPDANSPSRLTIDDGGLVDVTQTLYTEGGIIYLNGGSLRVNQVRQFLGLPTYTKTMLNFNSGTLAFIGDRLVGADASMFELLGNSLTMTSGKELAVEGLATLMSDVTIDGGTLSVGQIANAHRLNLWRGTLNITNDAITIGAGGTFPTLDVVEQLNVNVAFGTTNYGLVTGDGHIGGAFYNAAGGELRAQPGRSLLLTGAENTNDGQIRLLGGELEFTNDLTNNAGAFLSGNGSLVTGSGLTNDGIMNFAGTANIVGSVNNSASGRIISGGGGATIFFDDVVNEGEIRTSTNGFTVFFGDLTGSGSFTGAGTVNVEGDFSPGSSPATVNFAGDLAFGVAATLEIELGGATPGSQHDKLNVTGELSLDGALHVSLINGFTPIAGQSFHILEWGTLAGAFSSLALPTHAGLAWDTSQLYTLGVLRVMGVELPGDFNQDGAVDAADYVVWRKNPSAFGGIPGGYNTWRANFGRAAGAGASRSYLRSTESADGAVPEPAILLLAGVSAASGLLIRPTRR